MLPTHVVAVNVEQQRQQQQQETPSSSISMGVTYPPTADNGSFNRSTRANGTAGGQLKTRGIASLTVQTQVPYDDNEVADSASQKRTTEPLAWAQPSRWGTLEFKFYYLVFLVIVPYMIYVPTQLSAPSNPNYTRFAKHLVPGWLFGRRRDDSDFQYKTFRDYFPLLVALMVAFLVLSKCSELATFKSRSNDYQRVDRASSRRRTRPNRLAFLAVFTAIFILALHGTNSMKLLLVCFVNFALAKALGGRAYIAPLALWIWNLTCLFTIHWNNGLPYGGMHSALEWLDEYQGLLPRWQINFNITMLRLLSFSLDVHQAKLSSAGHMARTQRGGDDYTDEDKIVSDARQRASIPLKKDDYSMLQYLLYALYPPLFIAGPIMTFNDFTRQLHRPLSIPPRHVASYAIRLAASILSMEFVLHFLYVNAIKDAKAWQGATPMELSMIGFWNLIVVWLKLLIPWRFFRLWALADGVEPPENMVRCMANNYSTLGFWRSWHRSYNLWLIRYIYIPIGGSKNAVAATFLVFSFVALWHDVSLTLLQWGWLVSLFILPEILARKLVSGWQKEQPTAAARNPWWLRHLSACGGVFNILLMMTANLVGFAIGTDGILYMWNQLLGGWNGLGFMVAACATLFVGVQVMSEYRQEEARHGIDRKC